MTVTLPALPPATVGPLLPSPVLAAAPVALLAQGAGAPALPFSNAAADAALSPPAQAAEAGAEGAAMRPDQALLARQLAYAPQDGATLARHWRAQVRGVGSQLSGLALAASGGQLSPAQLATAQQGQAVRAAEQQLPHPDAWRFAVHAGAARDAHLAVLARDADQPPGRRKRGRAALRLELELADGSTVVAQVEPLPQGVAIELCAATAQGMEQLRRWQPELEAAMARAGVTVLRWQLRDRLPLGSSHATVANAQAAAESLTLDVFRAVTELALRLPAEGAARET
ncbi:hypothetical protein LK542_01760 [Massilia sp. IC2-477]|uniref:hypothetical protein n=1 Tax=Massilia sp. IC2-477 TaxID=2887198 RepID=UPI001D125BEB|nr:hypothetical protein [Massilia sp. IC2-477]MCC2954337.1 hypothetical protein [Massilia sp. IC2-477]